MMLAVSPWGLERLESEDRQMPLYVARFGCWRQPRAGGLATDRIPMPTRPDHLFSKPLRRLLWILGGLALFGQFSILMLHDLAVMGNPDTPITSGWITLVHSALTFPADIRDFTSGSTIERALYSLVIAALGSLAIFAFAGMRRERLAWPFFVLCFGTSLYASFRSFASTVHDPERFNYIPPRVIWLDDGTAEYLVGLFIPGAFYLICIPILLIRWMSIDWRQGRARPPVPLPLAEPGRLLPRPARVLVLMIACVVAYGLFATALAGNIYLEGVPWPDGDKRYLAFSVLTLPRDWHFSWIDSVARSLGGAIVKAAFASLGLVVLATCGRQRLAPAVAAVCAIWSSMTVIALQQPSQPLPPWRNGPTLRRAGTLARHFPACLRLCPAPGRPADPPALAESRELGLGAIRLSFFDNPP